MSDKKSSSRRSIILIGTLSLIAWSIVISLYLTIRLFSFPTGSMEPTIEIGDSFVVNIRYYKNNKIKRGDIIAFYPPRNEDRQVYLKRCVAIEGDKFSIKNGNIYINDSQIQEKYTHNRTSYRGFDKILLEGIVPANCIITLGDNRENSLDSRFYGYVPFDQIVGKALFIYNSKDLSRIGTKL